MLKDSSGHAGLSCRHTPAVWVLESENRAGVFSLATGLSCPAFNAEIQHRSWDRQGLTYETVADGTLTSYYVNDLTHSQSQGGVTNTYGLDASFRQRERITTGGSEAGTSIYHYAGGSDSPAWTEDIKGEETSWTRNIGTLGGGLGAIENDEGEVTLQLANMHGDVVSTVEDDPEASAVLSKQRFDEFGNPLQSASLLGGSAEYGWLGGKTRRTQLPSGVIQMGLRSYVPALGRFLTPDPIMGGSASAYDYANQDPVNNIDLAGTACKKNNASKKDCRKAQKRGERRVRSVVADLKTRLRKARAKRAHSAHSSVALPGGGNLTLPWEKDAKEAINMATGLLKDVNDATSCDAASKLAVGGSAWYGLKATEVAKSVAPAATKLSARFAAIGAILGIADLMGFC